MYLDDMIIDKVMDIPPITVKKEQMIEFSKIYDPFPLHNDEEFAKTTRYGQIIAPGVMCFMLVWANFIRTGFLGDEHIAGKSTKIEWFNPVYDGDVIYGKVRVAKITRRNTFNGIADIVTEVYNQRGELVLTDLTESIVKYRQPEKAE